MTTEEYALAFRLLDDYARRSGCFVSEFWCSSGEYLLCLRPAGGERDAPDRYLCKYVQISSGDTDAIVSQRALPNAVIGSLEEALATVKPKP